MSSLTTIEKRCFEDLLGMSTGIVLDFTNRSFAQLFHDNANINIYDEKYSLHGDSKANRMRGFWELESDPVVGKILLTILEVWKYENDKKSNSQENIGYVKCFEIVSRLIGKHPKGSNSNSESEFLTQDFGEITIRNLNIDSALAPIINNRLKEARICLKNDLSLSVIFHCGSILEGILLSIAKQHTKEFNQATISPKDKQGKVKPFHGWTLANLIDVAYEMEFLGLDVKKFSHAIRDFRNYIHPYQQMLSNFNPDRHTANICMQVLKAAIADLSER